MKQLIKLIVSSCALISIIACGNKNNVSDTQNTSNIDISSDVVEESSITPEPSSIDSSSSVEPSSVIISSSEAPTPSSSEVISSSEAPISSSQDIPSSSEQPSSSLPEGTYYHVVFQNYDETVLYEVDVLEGETATYGGETPIKPEDDEFTYEFKGWDKDLTSILSDVTTMAEYSYTAKENWGSIIWF